MGKFYIKLKNFPPHKVTIGPDVNMGYGPGVIAWIGRVYIMMHDYGTQQDVYAPDSDPPPFESEYTVTFTYQQSVYSGTTGQLVALKGKIWAFFYDSIWQVPYQTEINIMSAEDFIPEDNGNYEFDMQTGVFTKVQSTEPPTNPDPLPGEDPPVTPPLPPTTPSTEDSTMANMLSAMAMVACLGIVSSMTKKI